ncbi:MAG TPA: ATP-binding protein [Gemmatimonadaceae bacterium]|jgi:hypothetical protein
MLQLRTLGASEIHVGDERIGPEQPIAFALVFLLATSSPAPLTRRELASLLWPDVGDRDRNHRFRSLLHRLRRLGVPLVCSEVTVVLEEIAVDYRRLTKSPRSVADVRADVPIIGAVLPNLYLTASSLLADRIDDVRDVITATVMRWLRTAIGVARAEGDWALVERLARLALVFDDASEDAWLSLAEAQCITSDEAAALRTLDEFAGLLGANEQSMPATILRQRIVEARASGSPAKDVDCSVLIGRDDVLRRIWSAVSMAREGLGGAIVLWGPAGIGKTRLLREVERVRMIESVRVVRVGAQAVHALRPFSLVVELIARLLDEPGAAGCVPEAFAALQRLATPKSPNGLPAESLSPDVLYDLLIELLEAIAEEGPLMILIDDMHVVDGAIWPFWRAMFRWSTDHRVHWLLGYRALREAELLTLPEASLLHRVAIGCLHRTEAALLVDGRRRGCCLLDFDDIFARVGGHPALLCAFARSVDELPRSTARIVDDWIARLAAAPLDVLRLLASLGGSATARSLADVAPLNRAELTTALGELARIGLVYENAGIVHAHQVWADAALALYGRADRFAINID